MLFVKLEFFVRLYFRSEGLVAFELDSEDEAALLAFLASLTDDPQMSPLNSSF